MFYCTEEQGDLITIRQQSSSKLWKVKTDDVLILKDLESKHIDHMKVGEEFVALVDTSSDRSYGNGVVISFTNMPKYVKDSFSCVDESNFTWVKLYNTHISGIGTRHKNAGYNGYRNVYTAYMNANNPIANNVVCPNDTYCSCVSPVLIRSHALGEWFNVCKTCGKERL